MTTNNKGLLVLAVLVTDCFLPTEARAQTIPNGAAIDAEVNKLMTRTSAKGMAVAVIDHGKVSYVHAYGLRNTKGDPLTIDTVMYGASKADHRKPIGHHFREPQVTLSVHFDAV